LLTFLIITSLSVSLAAARKTNTQITLMSSDSALLSLPDNPVIVSIFLVLVTVLFSHSGYIKFKLNE